MGERFIFLTFVREQKTRFAISSYLWDICLQSLALRRYTLKPLPLTYVQEKIFIDLCFTRLVYYVSKERRLIQRTLEQKADICLRCLRMG